MNYALAMYQEVQSNAAGPVVPHSAPTLFSKPSSAGMHGQSAGMADGAGLSGPEASSAWFVPFNMGGNDPFSGVFGRGSASATPNALGGLQQQGP